MQDNETVQVTSPHDIPVTQANLCVRTLRLPARTDTSTHRHETDQSDCRD
ncbi:hypothetical protein ACFYZ9_06290 [Streptomyces sp. NPDC001691]